jgi:hypothetical protein
MELKIAWQAPILLRDAARDERLIYNFQRSKLPESPGVYIFGRRHSGHFEALYVGKAGNIRGRAHGQLKNLPLMLHLQKAKSGKRLVYAGRFIPKPGQREEKCVALLERALIRYFLSEGHDLVNIQGTRLRRHEVTSNPSRWIVPKLMFVDRAKGE